MEVGAIYSGCCSIVRSVYSITYLIVQQFIGLCTPLSYNCFLSSIWAHYV